MRVVVHHDTVTSVRTTIRRQIWIPGIKLMIVQALLHVCMSLDRKENRVKLGHYIVCVYMWMYIQRSGGFRGGKGGANAPPFGG